MKFLACFNVEAEKVKLQKKTSNRHALIKTPFVQNYSQYHHMVSPMPLVGHPHSPTFVSVPPVDDCLCLFIEILNVLTLFPEASLP